MKRLGLVLVIAGAVGLAYVALGFAADYQPMWMRSAKRLPDQETFTRLEVVRALRGHVEHVRTRYLLGVVFSVVEIVGAVVLVKSSARHEHTTA
jgi:hypothetical protein